MCVWVDLYWQDRLGSRLLSTIGCSSYDIVYIMQAKRVPMCCKSNDGGSQYAQPHRQVCPCSNQAHRPGSGSASFINIPQAFDISVIHVCSAAIQCTKFSTVKGTYMWPSGRKVTQYNELQPDPITNVVMLEGQVQRQLFMHLPQHLCWTELQTMP